MELSFSKQVNIPAGVLARELEQEAVILNLDTGSYFGLDEVGTRMWVVLTSSESIQAAYETLLAEYEVEPDQLRADMQTLMRQLLENKLVELHEH